MVLYTVCTNFTLCFVYRYDVYEYVWYHSIPLLLQLGRQRSPISKRAFPSQRRPLMTELIEAFLSISQLKELEFLISHDFSARYMDVPSPSFVRLVQMPNLRHLVLPHAGLRDEHAIGMAQALMENGNGHLEYLDIRSGWGRPSTCKNAFGQDGWDALFRLVQHDPLIQIHATGLHVPPNVGPRCIERNYTFDFLLRHQDAVQRHLLMEEGSRVRLRDAGFDDLLTTIDAPNDAAWVEVMAKVSSDNIALFHILRAHPAICDLEPASTRKRKRSL